MTVVERDYLTTPNQFQQLKRLKREEIITLGNQHSMTLSMWHFDLLNMIFLWFVLQQSCSLNDAQYFGEQVSVLVTW